MKFAILWSRDLFIAGGRIFDCGGHILGSEEEETDDSEKKIAIKKIGT